MQKFAYALALGLAFAACHVTPAAAQSRVFVSGSGSDSNNDVCTLAAPCRSFQHAHDVATAGSEIAVLDTAGYGAVHIQKSISIVNPGGVEAGIAVTSGEDAIIIDAPGGVVNLRGLTLDGLGIGRNGITINTVAKISVEQSVIRNFKEEGIYFSVPAPSNLFVTDTMILDNGDNGVYALRQDGSVMKATLTRVQAVNNITGVAAEVDVDYNTNGTNDAIVMLISDSTLDHNSTGAAATGAVDMALDNVKIVDNATGLLLADAPNHSPIMTLSRSWIRALVSNDGTSSQIGWKIAGEGILYSTSDNVIQSNSSNTGNLTPTSYR